MTAKVAWYNVPGACQKLTLLDWGPGAPERYLATAHILCQRVQYPNVDTRYSNPWKERRPKSESPQSAKRHDRVPDSPNRQDSPFAVVVQHSWTGWRFVIDTGSPCITTSPLHQHISLLFASWTPRARSSATRRHASEDCENSCVARAIGDVAKSIHHQSGVRAIGLRRQTGLFFVTHSADFEGPVHFSFFLRIF